jgi:phosphoribosylaminoimidazolecarboxamide formyltransferase/IMP cyclohydrolase
MTQPESISKIKRAIISVSDKTGVADFARILQEFGIEIFTTGGTANHLRAAGVMLRDLSDLTEFPEMMDGRVKTLHPKVHGGLLALRDNAEHVASMIEHGIEPIDLLVVNLYPFEETIRRPSATIQEAIEQIDIGGPAMIRSAAKNHESVTVVVSVDDYKTVIDELKQHGGTSIQLRRTLAVKAFQRTAAYDLTISTYLSMLNDRAEKVAAGNSSSIGTQHMGSNPSGQSAPQSIDTAQRPPDFAQWTLKKKHDLRYGENPHQVAALYDTSNSRGVAGAQLLSGKEMSYNNYVDADAAWQLVCDFDETTCAIIKHTNPAGVGQGATLEEAYRKALATDRVSAFGGIVAFNRPLDEPTARAAIEIFTEVLIAPSVSDSALEVLKKRKNLRVLEAGEPKMAQGLEFRQISGGMLVQTRDLHRLTRNDLKFVSNRRPSDDEISALLFAWTVCKHTKSNAIVYARAGQTVGVGAGQMSRVDSVKLGAMRAFLPIKGSVLASDAFFPFRDGIDEAAKHGITAIIQPGGSIKDPEVIAAADEHNVAMVFTGVRHFKH